MLMGVPKETHPGEHRVALTPDSVQRLIDDAHRVVVEAGAGLVAGLTDDAYRAAGAEIGSADAAWSAELVAVVRAPDDAATRLSSGAALVGFLQPLEHPAGIASLAEAGVTAMPFEMLPRTTLAQAMDALSSQANLAGYQAVLLGADRMQRIMPMMTTAAGTIRPATTLVLGAGVAGLQAIATARRLGSVVYGFDVRPVVAEQVRSLGARFIELDLEADGADTGGYAKALGDDAQERIIRGLQKHVNAANLVVSTAQIPGRPAPLLIDDTTLDACAPGTVIVDMAAATGGNTSATVVGEEVNRDGVIILGPENLASRVSGDASTLYARNVVALLKHLTADGVLALDFDDEIADGIVVTHEGTVRSERVAALLEGTP